MGTLLRTVTGETSTQTAEELLPRSKRGARFIGAFAGKKENNKTAFVQALQYNYMDLKYNIPLMLTH